MRKTLLTIATALLTFTMSAQLQIINSTPVNEIGKVAVMGDLLIELNEQDGAYIFRYRDFKFRQLVTYKDFTISNEDDLNALYNVINSNMTNPPKEPISLSTGTGNVILLSFTKNIGTVSVKIVSGDVNTSIHGYTAYLTKKQIDKLFGKR